MIPSRSQKDIFYRFECKNDLLFEKIFCKDMCMSKYINL